MSRFEMAAAAFGIAMLMSLTPGTAAAQCSCVIADLGTLGGAYSEAFGINNAGQAVGQNGQGHAVLWTAAGGMTDIGFTSAAGINDSQQVVGWSGTTSNAHAVLWTAAAGQQDLGTLGGLTSFANAVNN